MPERKLTAEEEFAEAEASTKVAVQQVEAEVRRVGSAEREASRRCQQQTAAAAGESKTATAQAELAAAGAQLARAEAAIAMEAARKKTGAQSVGKAGTAAAPAAKRS